MEQNYTPIGPVELPTSDSIFSLYYDFETTTIEQVNQANEVLEFKKKQIDNQPGSFAEVVRSGGSDYFTKVLSYILVRKQGEKIIPFDRNSIKITEDLINKLPAKEYKRLEEIMTDFFTLLGKSLTVSAVVSRAMSVKDMLSMFGTTALMTQGINSQNLQTSQESTM